LVELQTTVVAAEYSSVGQMLLFGEIT